MPESPLPPFSTFAQEFELGGEPWTLRSSARRWQEFADEATSAASAMRGMDASRFKGDEGELYLEKLDNNLPDRLDTTAEAHGGVSTAVAAYADQLTDGRTGMLPLRTAAPTAHTRVQNAVAWVNRAEGTLAAARVKEAAAAVASKTAAASAAVTGGATSGAAAAAAAAHTEAIAATRAAEADLQAARTEHTNATTAWEGLRTDASSIHTEMETASESAKRAINDEAQKRFSENPSGLSALAEGVSDWFSDNADWLTTLSEGLMTVGGLIAMLPIPGAALVGGAMVLVGGAITLGLWATGNMSTSQMAMNAVGAIPGVGKGVQLVGKGGKALTKAAGQTGKKGPQKSPSSKGAEKDNCPTGKDPINLATGEVFDQWTDLTIGGTLPLVITRYHRSGFRDGIAFGRSQASLLDMRLEVGVESVTMVGEDGAVQEFDEHPSDDGSEILPPYANKPLSFVDGAYRVRDVPAGITYEFALFGDQASVSAAAVAPGSSLAGVTDATVSVGLSAVVHRTGHRIEVEYDQRTGRPQALRHSGGATVHIDTDVATGRVMGLAVSDAETSLTTVSLYEYSAYGDMTAQYDSTGVPFRYTWDHDHRMTSWTDRKGSTTYHYVYDQAGRVAMQGGTRGVYPLVGVHLDDHGSDAPEGGTVIVTIEPVTDLATEDEGDSKIFERFHKLDNLPVVDALLSGGLAAAGLDSGGRAGKADRENPVPWADVAPEHMLADEELGTIRAWVYRSNAQGQLWRIVSPEGVVTDFERDARHNLIRRESGDGSVLRWTVDEYGCVTSTVTPDGREQRIEYAPLGFPVKQVDFSGRVTEVELDAIGNVTAIETPDGARTLYEYEVRASGSVPRRVIAADGSVVEYECDDAGRVIRCIDPAGGAWTYGFNLFGDAVSVMDPEGATTFNEWTVEGRLVRRELADGTDVVLRYDANGNCISRTDEAGNTTQTEYGPMDIAVASIDEVGGRLSSSLSTQLLPFSISNPDGHEWKFEENRDGYVVAETDYNGARTEYELDGLRRRKSITDALGRVERRKYDMAGRLIEVSSDDGLTAYTYDASGDLIEAANSDAVVAFDRDEFGRVVGETINGIAVRSEFDLLGRRTRRVVADEADRLWATDFSFDAAGRLNSLQTTAPGEVAGWAAGSRFAYDGRGRQTDRVLGAAAVVETRWDVRSRKRSEGVLVGPDEAVAGRAWQYRADGYVTGTADVLRGEYAFTLDAAGRVLSSRRSGDALVASAGGGRQAVVAESFAYSGAGVLTASAAPELESGSSVASSPVAGTSNAGEVRRVSSAGTLVTRLGRTRYRYDAVGQLVERVTTRLSRKPEVTRFTYTAEGQIRTATVPDGSVWTYFYDAFGRRVGKRHEDAAGRLLGEVTFGWDGDDLVLQSDRRIGDDGVAEGSDSWVFVYHPVTGDPVEQHELHDGPAESGEVTPGVGGDPTGWSQDAVDSEFFAIVTDLAGAPMELIDPETGAVAGSQTSTVWGRRSWRGASTPLAFAGQQVDAETGLHYNRYRYYDPSTATYTSPDPLGINPNLAAANAYVHNPHTWVDPLGLACKDRNGDDFFWDGPQRNKGLAGENHKTTGVPFDKDGFPDFKDHLYNGGKGLNDVKITPTGNRSGDFRAANEAAGFGRGNPQPSGFTWHHHQDYGRMQLVETKAHKRTGHTGGASMWPHM